MRGDDYQPALHHVQINIILITVQPREGFLTDILRDMIIAGSVIDDLQNHIFIFFVNLTKFLFCIHYDYSRVPPRDKSAVSSSFASSVRLPGFQLTPTPSP